ncbi:MAG TPA: Flp pilus assembly protein CpaB [Alphaproteobacteria bacterium]|jgi:pilus assembly protein CpaB|nr:Flp pilus assembly protein CpaB [Micavibrio sp.]MBK9562797.1 Flp pilus assembly protein CpaB [Micavibrio sp.]HQX28316.1 Flp pilus assembly protein CpaB [Alphaproteobacteria bacterium]
MNKNVVIVLGGALVVAIVVALLVQITLGGKKPAVQEARVEVLVAAKDLGIGRELKDGDVSWQAWPEALLVPGAIVREKDQKPLDAMKGRLARNVGKGELMMSSALLGESKGNYVAASLDPGMRAVAISVKAASMVGGFIGPGDYVDIIMTYKTNIDSIDDDPYVQSMIDRNIMKMATETILQNVKVLAVDQSAKRPEDEKIKVGKTVTLALNATDSEKISLADSIGELTLSLRGVGDNKIIEKNWEIVSDARLINIDDEVFTEYLKMKKGAGINSDSVRIYNGSSVMLLPAN